MQSESSAVHPSKRQRLSSPSAYKKEQCVVVFHCWVGDPEAETEMSDEYQIYIVDPNSSSSGGDNRYTHIEPTIRFKGNFPALALCGLDSTLYLFEGTYAGKFQITPEIMASSNYLLEKRNLVPIQPMPQSKINPTALPTPDGKSILVFSSLIDYSSVHTAAFELYDVALDSWEMLPPLPSIDSGDYYYCHQKFLERYGGHYHIEGYGFKTESHFAVTMSYGAFVLDLSSKDRKWKPLGPGVPSCKYFIGLEGGFFFTPGGVSEIRCGKEIGGFRIPSSLFPSYDSELIVRFQPWIALLGRENGVYETCLVQAERHRNNTCRLFMDVCSADIQKFITDVENYRRDNNKKKKRGGEGPLQKPSPDITAIKTLKFLIHFDLALVPVLMCSFSI